MNKKLDNLLENEINRFKAINKYQDTLNEVSYRFYNEADEQRPEENPMDEPAQEPMDNAGTAETPPMDDTSSEPPTDGLTEPTDGMEEPPMDNTDMSGMDDMSGADDMSGMDDMNATDDMDATGEDVTEIDVTDLVNTTNDIQSKLDGSMGKIDMVISKIEQTQTLQSFAVGSGRGSVGRAVDSDSKGLQFESSHWQKNILNIYCQLY